jgi:hypothetical protein
MRGVVGRRLHIWALALIISFVSAAPALAAAPSEVELRAVISTWRNINDIIEKGKHVSGKVPVYYLSRLFREPLTKDQKREIIEAARHEDRWRDIWFITVSCSDKGDLKADVYFVPDSTTSDRVRQGKAVHLNNDFGIRTWVYDYVQIGHRPPEKFQPNGPELPIDMPEGFTLEEVVLLSDLVYGRAAAFVDDGVERRPRKDGVIDPFQLAGGATRRVDQSNPILRFRRRGDQVDVFTGVQEGGLCGRGEVVHCKKENGVWVIKSVGRWIS